jgi:hypothetical protein
MNVKELIESLKDIDQDKIVIIGDASNGWSNIEKLKEEINTVSILQELYPVFSDN